METSPDGRVARLTALSCLRESRHPRYHQKLYRQRTLGREQGDLQESVFESRLDYLMVANELCTQPYAIQGVIRKRSIPTYSIRSIALNQGSKSILEQSKLMNKPQASRQVSDRGACGAKQLLLRLSEGKGE